MTDEICILTQLIDSLHGWATSSAEVEQRRP